MQITLESSTAVLVVPLRALVSSDEDRFVDCDSVRQILRTYRKYHELNEVEHALLERISNDLFEVFEVNSRTLVELVARSIE